MTNPFKFHRLEKLPPYVFAEVTELMLQARRAGKDVIDLGMGNPDLPTPANIVDKIRETAQNTRTHRYSSSRGIPRLRHAICEWYARNYQVSLDPETEAISLIGSKEGLAHFVLMTVGPGDTVLCQDPGYPIHQYSVAIAGGTLQTFSLDRGDRFCRATGKTCPSISAQAADPFLSPQPDNICCFTAAVRTRRCAGSTTRSHAPARLRLCGSNLRRLSSAQSPAGSRCL
jgi:histidinol-phosphate/aromatic aminotransferase/cobyric acid decarboxylase-like protein